MKVDTVAIGYAPVTDEVRTRIVTVLAERFQLPVLPESIVQFTEETASSAVYRVTGQDGQSYVVKTSIWVGPGPALEKVYEVSEALRLAGVPMAQTVRTTDGRFAGESGGKQYIVQSFVSGDHFSARPEEFTAAGAALGHFHQAGATYLAAHPQEEALIPQLIPVEKPYEESRALYSTGLRDTLLSTHTCSVPTVCAAFREQVAVIDRVIAEIDASSVNAADRQHGLLHNDFHTNNALFAADGSLNCFLDLDQMGVGPYIWDVGNTLASFASNVYTRNQDTDFTPLAAAFLTAYHQTHPLPAEEYRLTVMASQRWDVMRMLRSLRRHHFENDRLPGLLPKIADRLIPRLTRFPAMMSFLDDTWIHQHLT